MDLTFFNQFVPENKNKVDLVESNNVVIYTRVSSKEQADNNASLETQRKALDQFAKQHDLNVLEYFGGTFESAKTDGRKEFNRMLQFIKKSKRTQQPVSRVLVYSTDRFSRTGSQGAIGIANELRIKYGVRLFAITQPTDTKDPSGRLHQNIQLLFSEYDNELRREKCVKGMVDKLEDGIWCLKPPFGYSSITKNGIRTIEPDENAHFIAKAFKWKAQGMKNDEILKKLAAIGFKIYKQRLHHILNNPFYCGVISVSMLGGKSVEGKHTPIVSKRLFMQVHELGKTQAKYGVKHAKEFPNVPLKVFMCCDHCNQPMTGYIVKAKNLWYYKCRTSGCKSNHSAKKVNAGFSELLGNFTMLPELIEPFKHILKDHFKQQNKDNQVQQKVLKENLTQVENKLERIEEKHYIEESMPADIFAKFNARLTEERTEILKELDKTQNDSSNLDKFIDAAMQFCAKLPSMWSLSDYALKEKLQQLVFPQGIYLNKENRTFRTPEIQPLFELTARFMGSLAQNEKGPTTNKGDRSNGVGPAGFEPATPCL